MRQRERGVEDVVGEVENRKRGAEPKGELERDDGGEAWLFTRQA